MAIFQHEDGLSHRIQVCDVLAGILGNYLCFWDECIYVYV